MPGKRVLITGAAGFIGSAVARHCVAEGHEVLALVRPASDLWRLEDLRDRVRFVVGDLLTGPLPIEAPAVDLCIHLAWNVTPGEYLQAPHHFEYQHATLHLARQLVAAGCSRLVAVGTCFEYDSRAGLLSETTPLAPRSAYAAGKLATFEALQPFCRREGLQLAWARLFYQYGPAEDPRRIVPYVIRSLLQGQRAELTTGDQIRDFLHVADVAAALCAVAETDLVGTVNIGSGQGITIADLSQRIAQLVHRPDLVALGARPIPEGEPMRIVADTTRLRTVTGWAARFDLTSGLLDTVDWWNTHLRTYG
jgi:nucleoside-diphosphate-sugar epimerase